MIRFATPSDAADIARIYQPIVRETVISFETTPPAPPEIERRIRDIQSFYPWLVAGPEGEVHGYAYASRHRERAAYQWSVDVAVYVDADHRRKGLAATLYEELFRLLRLQGFHAAHAGITLPNAASVGLHQSLGFKPVGIYPKVGYKHGAWHDVGWWQLELEQRKGEPQPLKTVARVVSEQRERAAG
jgi:L-amino acid N-acyltransferase YncA